MIIPVSTDLGEYNIILRRGALQEVDKYFDLDRKVLIVTDSGVPQGYSKTVADKCSYAKIVTIKQGEQSKSFENFQMLLQTMVDSSFTRSDCVVAVGGGVVGDLAGFAAACYMRGVDFYNIPTTLLSQVDSSIGGKVAIDFSNAKNIVGAFYQPKGVLIDSVVLKTLDKRQLANGFAEAVKMSLTSDEKLFETFEDEDIHENIDRIIERSLRIKKSVVERDEKEQGLRKVLNFGHTLGHAIESNNIGRYYHGECVAMGMMPMCSESVRTRLEKVLEKVGLPTEYDGNFSELKEALCHDKKLSGSSLTAVYVDRVGSFVFKKMTVVEFMELVGEGRRQ